MYKKEWTLYNSTFMRVGAEVDGEGAEGNFKQILNFS